MNLALGTFRSHLLRAEHLMRLINQRQDDQERIVEYIMDEILRVPR